MSLIRDIKTFIVGAMNLDDDPRTLKANEHRNIWNSILNIAEGSRLGCLQNIKGTSNVFDMDINASLDPPDGLVAIGACEDVKDNALILFLCDPLGVDHSILKIHLKNYLCEWVLKSQPVLNFQLDYKIGSAWIIDDLLGWTDGYEKTPFVDYNPPRKINIVRAIGFSNTWSATVTYYPGQIVCWTTVNNTTIGCYKYVNQVASSGNLVTDTDYWELIDPYCYTSITFQLLDRIKWPPVTITAEYDTDTTRNTNNLNGKMFQFRYRYVYDDFEKSVWSPISDMPLPSSNELLNGEFIDDVAINNRIKLTINTGIESVIRIELAYREGNIGLWKKFDTLDKYDQNGSSLSLSTVYYFYNDRLTEPLDQQDTERLYDFVPQISQHEDVIEKNRILDANYTEGYTNVIPNVSLSYIQTAVELSGLNELIKIQFPQNTNTIYADLQDGLPKDTYIITEIYKYAYYTGGNPNPITSWPQQVGERFIIYIKVNENETTASVVTRLGIEIHNTTGITVYVTQGLPNRLGLYYLTVVPANPPTPAYSIYCNWLTVQVTSASPKVKSIKSGTTRQLGIAYYDDPLRGGGVVTDSSFILSVPYLTENHSSPGNTLTTGTETIHKTEITTSISHIPPMWAKYYCWCVAPSSISFFIDFHIVSSDIIVENNNIWIKFNYGIMQMADTFGKSVIRSYSWQKGDRIRFLSWQPDATKNEQIYFHKLIDYEILGVDYNAGDDGYEQDESTASSTNSTFIYDEKGNKIRDVGQQFLVLPLFTKSTYNIPNDTRIVVCEIYRPRLESDAMVFHEIENLRPILNPHTSTRLHSATVNQTSLTPATSTLTWGDVYVKARTTGDSVYMVEASQFSDFFDSEWNGIGRPNILLKDGRRTEYTTKLIFSGKYIQNTKTNELSKVLSSDSIELLEKFGPINFIKEIGFTLKVIQKYKPSSIYVGRQGLTQADVSRGEVLFASDNTLGTVTVSESSYGTEHPLSCLKHERNLYWYDINSGCIVRDSGNGIRSISQPEDGDNETGYKIKSFLQAKSKTFQENGVDVYAAYDGKYDIVYFSFVDQTDSTQSFTIGFHEPSNRWISFYSFIPDFITGMKMTVMSWKDSALWLHNAGIRMNFYGVQYSQTITTISNKEPLIKKRFRSIKQQSNKVFDLRDQGDVWIDADETYSRGQTGLIKAGAFRAVEGGIYAPFGRNMTTHQLLPSNDDYINGDEFRGDYIELTLHNDSTDEVNLFSIEVDAVESKV